MSIRPFNYSSDTILRGIKELGTANTTYTYDTVRSYDFNTATKQNGLLVKILVSTGQLLPFAANLSEFITKWF